MEIVWDVLLGVDDDDEERWVDIDLFLRGSFGTFSDVFWNSQLLQSGDAGLISGAITLLHKVDVVNMLGRYLLLPYYLRNNVPNILDGAPDVDPATIRAQGLTAIDQMADALEITFKRAQAGQLYSRGSHLHYISMESEVVWMRLGMALGFMKHLKHGVGRYSCMYARCPTPVDARFESGSIGYCSARCQAA
ncbi:hypothetical protein FRC10_007516, partial [Ceratobasidium sp. 414]